MQSFRDARVLAVVLPSDVRHDQHAVKQHLPPIFAAVRQKLVLERPAAHVQELQPPGAGHVITTGSFEAGGVSYSFEWVNQVGKSA